MPLIFAIISGALFGLGLAVSQMMDPAKVLSFLDVAGAWDPSLILVMGGAVGVTMPGFWLILKRPGPFFGSQFHVPEAIHLDAKLLIGAGLFGIGWGISGLCPGPAFAGLATGNALIIGFVVTMLAGYRLASVLDDLHVETQA